MTGGRLGRLLICERTVEKSVRGPIEASASVMKELFQVKSGLSSQSGRQSATAADCTLQGRRWARLILGSRWRVLWLVVARLDPRSGPMGLSQFECAMGKEETRAQ